MLPDSQKPDLSLSSSEKIPVGFTEPPPVENEPASRSLGEVLLVVSGLVLVLVSFGFSAYWLSRPLPQAPAQLPMTPAVPTQEAEMTVRPEWLTGLDQLPKNPQVATATCQSTGESLLSGQRTACPDPVFTWSGAQVFESGAEIAGYRVYFGENQEVPSVILTEPEKEDGFEGVFQTDNSYQPTNLASGKTYYLLVQTVSTSLSPLLSRGGRLVDQVTGEIETASFLFKYVYE